MRRNSDAIPSGDFAHDLCCDRIVHGHYAT
jgi:hypothetical protein